MIGKEAAAVMPKVHGMAGIILEAADDAPTEEARSLRCRDHKS